MFAVDIFKYFVFHGEGLHMVQHTCGGHRTIYGNQFSPTMWVSGIELSSPGLVTSVFDCCVILSAFIHQLIESNYIITSFLN